MAIPYNPEVHERDAPSSTALNLVTEWRSAFLTESLAVDSDVVQAYQNTTLGTRNFHLHLIEITAVALHTIAANLFLHTNQPPYKRSEPRNIDFEFPTDDNIKEPEAPIRREIPTYLYHQNSIYHEQYPMGVADMVGYWAEYQILGGVVLFARGESENDFHDVFLHPSSGFRVFRLSETQINQFVDLGLCGEEESTPCPFPIKAERHAWRIDHEHTFALNIFRNKYERNPPNRPTWLTVHPKRRLEDDPDLMEIAKYIRENCGGDSS